VSSSFFMVVKTLPIEDQGRPQEAHWSYRRGQELL
jgi:hypothetical protein